MKLDTEKFDKLNSKVDALTADVQEIKKMVSQLHQLQTGQLFNPDLVKKKLTAKEKRDLEEKERKIRVQKMINDADLRVLAKYSETKDKK